MKKMLVAVLSVIVVFLSAALVWMGVFMFREKAEPVPVQNTTRPAATEPTLFPEVTVSYAIPVPQGANLQPEMPATEAGQTTNDGQTTAHTTTGSAIPTTGADDGGAAVRTDYTKQEAIALVGNSVAYLKAAKNFRAARRRVTAISLDECSASALRGTVQKVIDRYTGDKTQTFSFSNGQAIDTETNTVVSPNDVIPPGERGFSLEAAGVSSYNVAAEGRNTVITLHIVAEECTLSSPVPYYHAQAMNYIDLSEMDNSLASLTSASFTYQASTLILTLSEENLPVSLREIIPMNGKGEGSMLGFSASGSISGNMDEIWTFTW